MVKKVISNLDLLKVPGPDSISVVFLQNCEPELSYVLAELFINCLKVSLSPYCLKVSQWFLYLRILGEQSTAKN